MRVRGWDYNTWSDPSEKFRNVTGVVGSTGSVGSDSFEQKLEQRMRNVVQKVEIDGSWIKNLSCEWTVSNTFIKNIYLQIKKK